MLAWVEANEVLLWWLALGSLFVFALTLIALPVLLISMPEDYFLPSRRAKPPFARRHPLLRWVLRMMGNLVGCLLLLVGFVLLFLPGQGLLTMLAGLMLTDFPGKFRLERAIVGKPAIRRAIDELRRRAGRPPLVLEEREGADREMEPGR